MDTEVPEVSVRNRSRLDLICVPVEADHIIARERWAMMRERWERSGWVTADSVSPALVAGGGRGVRLDRPSARSVYGNQLGGFRVRCPACGGAMARDFARAMEASRSEGPLDATCSACHETTDFHCLDVRPPIRVGRSALIFEDVDGAQLTELGQQAVESVVGPFQVILRRVS